MNEINICEMKYFGGPQRWDRICCDEQNCPTPEYKFLYNEEKWFSAETKEIFDKVKSKYDFVLIGANSDEITLDDVISNDTIPFLTGHNAFEWIMFVDDFCRSQEIRMAMQERNVKWLNGAIADIFICAGRPNLIFEIKE